MTTNEQATKQAASNDAELAAAVWHLVATEPNHGVTNEERAEYERELEDLS